MIEDESNALSDSVILNSDSIKAACCFFEWQMHVSHWFLWFHKYCSAFCLKPFPVQPRFLGIRCRSLRMWTLAPTFFMDYTFRLQNTERSVQCIVLYVFFISNKTALFITTLYVEHVWLVCFFITWLMHSFIMIIPVCSLCLCFTTWTFKLLQ